MRIPIALGVAAFAFGVARVARIEATNVRNDDRQAEQPYAPSPSAAPYISLGYRETAADVFFIRLRGYFGSTDNDADAMAALCEAIVALDPQFHRVYEYCGHAMTLAKEGVDNPMLLRAIALLERGTREFPRDWRLPNLAGQIYTQDLRTNDAQLRKQWDEKGMLLVESAIRKPGAPAELQDWAAVMRTKYGQRERAIDGLKEMLLLTSDLKAQRILLDRLAKLEEQDADEIASELFEARRRFENVWRSTRPTLPATWYILLGAPSGGGFDMASLATGGRDLVELEDTTSLK